MNTEIHYRRNIEQELYEARKSHSKRQTDLHKDHKNRTFSRKLENCCSDNLQIFKVILILLAIIGSLFGSILLIIAGDPPYNQGQLYQYNDLIRLITRIHQNLIQIDNIDSNLNDNSTAIKKSTINPPLIEKRGARSRLKEIFNFNLIDTMNGENFNNRFGRFLKKLLPMKNANFESHDVILDDMNFYWKNYTAFQITFITLIFLSNFLLLLIWIFFIVLKNFHKSRLKQGASKKMDREFMNKQLKQFRYFKETRISHRILLIIILFQLSLIFLLLIRPNVFVVVLHQVSFLLLSVGCLASTSTYSSFKITSSNNQSDLAEDCKKQNSSLSLKWTNDGVRFERSSSPSKMIKQPLSIPSSSIQMPSLKPSSKWENIRSPLLSVNANIDSTAKSMKVFASKTSNQILNYPEGKNPFEMTINTNKLQQNDDEIEQKLMKLRAQIIESVDETIEREVEEAEEIEPMCYVCSNGNLSATK